MESMVLNEFTVILDDQEMAARFRVKPGSKAERQLTRLLGEARILAQPKATFKIMSPEVLDERTVRFGSIEFKSPLMAKQLDGQDLALPYMATCGRELAQWTSELTGLEQYMADEIMLAALRQAVGQLEDYLRERFGWPEVSAMNPGSLPKEWPITEQKALFSLMDDLPDRIGVNLLPSFLMNPGKSVSGIFFQTSEKFHNCQLCTKAACPSRKAPYQGESIGL